MDQNFGTPLQEPQKKSNTTLIIVIVVLILLCCCCVVGGAAAWWLWENGDALFGLTQAFPLLL